MRTCSLCGTEKPTTDFYSHSGRQCKPCKIARAKAWQQTHSIRRNAYLQQYNQRPEVRAQRAEYLRQYNEANRDDLAKKQRARTIMRKYGLTVEQHDAMYAEQAGRCAACMREAPLMVDHDHRTGRIRALLCNGCNAALGMVDDDPDRLHALIDYLDTHAV